MNDLSVGPVTPCAECGTLRVALDEARLQIAQLQAELRELRAQLNRNSSNSSATPSATSSFLRFARRHPQTVSGCSR